MFGLRIFSCEKRGLAPTCLVESLPSIMAVSVASITGLDQSNGPQDDSHETKRSGDHPQQNPHAPGHACQRGARFQQIFCDMKDSFFALSPDKFWLKCRDNSWQGSDHVRNRT